MCPYLLAHTYSACKGKLIDKSKNSLNDKRKWTLISLKLGKNERR